MAVARQARGIERLVSRQRAKGSVADLSCRASVPTAGGNEAGFQAHRPRPRFWLSARRENVRWPDAESPFCARSLLVGLHNRPIDGGILQIWLTAHCVEKTLEYAVLGPTAKPLELTVPVAETLGQVPPRRPCTHTPGNGFQNRRLLRAVTPGSPDLPGRSDSHLLPEFI